MDIHGMIDAPVLTDERGNLLNKPDVYLTVEQATLLRQYRKLKHQLQLREANYCERCWNGNRSDGMRGHVTDQEIVLECRCRNLVFRGMTL